MRTFASLLGCAGGKYAEPLEDSGLERSGAGAEIAPVEPELSLRLTEDGKSNREMSALQPPAITAMAKAMETLGCRQPVKREFIRFALDMLRTSTPTLN